MGRKIEVTIGFAAVMCLLAWLDLELCLWFFLAMLCHEAGHCVAMRLCGISIYRISMKAAGAVIHGRFCGYRQEVICAAAGPMASFLLAVCCCRVVPNLAVISLLLGVVNLLPLYPLDGGRILCAALLMRMEEAAAIRILSVVTFAVCCLLMIGACWITAEKQAGLWPIFAALVILWRAGEAGWTEH